MAEYIADPVRVEPPYPYPAEPPIQVTAPGRYYFYEKDANGRANRRAAPWKFDPYRMVFVGATRSDGSMVELDDPKLQNNLNRGYGYHCEVIVDGNVEMPAVIYKDAPVWNNRYSRAVDYPVSLA